MAADAYTGAGIVAMWFDELVPDPGITRAIAELNRNRPGASDDAWLLVGGYDWPPHLGSIPTAYLEAVAPVRSNKWPDNPLCRLNAGLRAGKKKRGME